MKKIYNSDFIKLNITQFLGALNDNLFRFIAILALISLKGESYSSEIAALSGFIFVFPFLLFSQTGGMLADKYSKSQIIKYTKFSEVLVMSIGAISFLTANIYMIYLTIFLMSAQSAIFGPAKQGIIPEIVNEKELAKANGTIVAFSFLAIISGSALAPLLSVFCLDSYFYASCLCIIISLSGVISAVSIKKTAALKRHSSLNANLISSLFHSLKEMFYFDSYLILAVAGCASFMGIGAFIQMNLISFGIENLHLDKNIAAALFVLVALGIAVGARIAGRLSDRNIELGIVPIGSVMISLSLYSLSFFTSLNAGTFLTLLLLGIGSGLFIVPLESFIQIKSPVNRRGEFRAVASFIGFSGVLAASMLTMLFAVKFDLADDILLRGGAYATLIITITALFVLPDFLLRFIGLVLVKCFYRLKITNIDNIPTSGKALLVSNHISWIDAFLLIATTQRRIRFIMDKDIYNIFWLQPFFKIMGIIPISAKDSKQKVAASLKQAKKELQKGFMVCIFAEGTISRSGLLNSFKSGLEAIIKNSDTKIIPVYLGGVWGSSFSYYHGVPFPRLKRLSRRKVNIFFGNPLNNSVTANEIRDEIACLSAKWLEAVCVEKRNLSRLFYEQAKRNFFKPAVADSLGAKLTYGKLLLASLKLKNFLEQAIGSDKRAGVLLPLSAGGVTANIALTFSGKIPVNINPTVSFSAIREIKDQSAVKAIITTAKVAAKYPDIIKIFEKVIFIENAFRKKSLKENCSLLLKLLSSKSLIGAGLRAEADDTALILFSSGTTAKPKGIVLSHSNIISNTEAMGMIFNKRQNKTLASSLPLFHSFGLTAGMWFPLLKGMKTAYHFNPLDTKTMIKMIHQQQAEYHITTPSFLASMSRKAKYHELKSLEIIITGAEKLDKNFALNFREKFGVLPLEGYGATELSPLALINMPDIKIHGVREKANKSGSAGRAIAGSSVKIINPETKETVQTGEEGMLIVKGPNVMKGYLNNKEATEKVIFKGWYLTNDMAVMDRRGFVTITGRLSRFSKIGGEMVPHEAIENKINDMLNSEEKEIVISAVPDKKRGESLVLLYREKNGLKEEIINVISKADIPNLWKPDQKNIFSLKEIPLLGSGKTDLKKIKDLALIATKQS